MPRPIEDYALIGDCETAALVGRDGSIDWLCLPRFDSDACFAALLGGPENGRWQIAPIGKARVKRQYRADTLILETEFQTSEGSVTVIDFMPLRKKHPEIMRLVRGNRGRVRMRMDLVIRFDYGRTVPWVTKLGQDHALAAIAGPHRLVLRTNAPVKGEGLSTVSEFTVAKGETVRFELQYGESFARAPKPSNSRASLREAEKLWRRWAARCKYKGLFADTVRRSLITLKALTYTPTGGILAAATTSLPEQPGGERNWDYRYCWVRDATFTLLALMHAGYRKEARRWRHWLTRSVAGSADQLQIMYGVAGERNLLEWEVGWLPGYEGASPVRVGNAASEQIQLDVYGELIDVLHQQKWAPNARGKSDAAFVAGLLERLKKIWREPDHGIWEVRGKKQHFTHSKVMAWVAFDRAIRGAERLRFDVPIDDWRKTRRQIHDDICHFGFNSGLGAFVQAYGSKEMDASLLMMPLVGFLPPSDARIRGTVEQIEKRLMRDGLVLRYETSRVDDGLPTGEGAFLPCSFWLADAYELMGRHRDAERLLKRLLKLPNDLGLLSEEYHLEDKRLVGNFPQAFSHVALINTVLNIYAQHGPALQRSTAKPSSHKAMEPR
jgi:GH15 family glucan-1,4-alpha-glucosidase